MKRRNEQVLISSRTIQTPSRRGCRDLTCPWLPRPCLPLRFPLCLEALPPCPVNSSPSPSLFNTQFRHLYRHVPWPPGHSPPHIHTEFTEEFGPWLRPRLHPTSCPCERPSHTESQFCALPDFSPFPSHGCSFTGPRRRLFHFLKPHHV